MLQRHDVAFTNNSQAQEILHGIVVENSSVLQWLEELGFDENDIKDVFHMQQRMTLYGWYKQWCKDSGTKALKQATFNQEVEERFGLVKSVERFDRLGVTAIGTVASVLPNKQMSVFIDPDKKIEDKKLGKKYASVLCRHEEFHSITKNKTYDSTTRHYNIDVIDMGTYEVDGKAIFINQTGYYEIDRALCSEKHEQFATGLTLN